MTRGQRKAELVSLVADLLAMHYRPSGIARIVGRTPERIGQIQRDLGLLPPRLRSVDDLPADMRLRVQSFLDSESEAIDVRD